LKPEGHARPEIPWWDSRVFRRGRRSTLSDTAYFSSSGCTEFVTTSRLLAAIAADEHREITVRANLGRAVPQILGERSSLAQDSYGS
jgi:hypothetical protein